MSDTSELVTKPVPSSYQNGQLGMALKVQAGGHKFIPGKQIPSMIDLGDGFILKAVQKPPKVTFMKLSNLTSGYLRPSVMDLKMGQITYDQNATQEKIASEISKFPPLQKLGFQITGMVIYDPGKDAYETITNKYTRKLTEETIISHGLSLFFRLQKENSRKDVLPQLLQKLQVLENWFSQQKKFSFIASSLLISYDGCQQLNSGKAKPCDEVRLHLIDFAHVFPSTSIDHNVLFGIKKLKGCLQTMLNEVEGINRIV
ncbi:kinase [Plakobranchus ocellatus]|uniref:Kinase n=1 Tax=Plakobranchus ocellatus TaxID=259542 RepID=A0AAV4CHP4_9GAST|nr:kinase [Plakobranchus ocellatus]